MNEAVQILLSEWKTKPSILVAIVWIVFRKKKKKKVVLTEDILN